MAGDVAADRKATLGATMASLPAETRKASPTASRTVKNTVLRIVALLCCKPRSAPIVVPNSDFRANEMQPRGGPGAEVQGSCSRLMRNLASIIAIDPRGRKMERQSRPRRSCDAMNRPATLRWWRTN
jgi:hypothetical protein